MRLFFKKILTIITLMLSTSVFAEAVSLDFQNIAIQDALHILAKFLKQSIVIGPKVTGSASIHLHHISYQEAFDLLLSANNLVKKRVGNVWFISSQAEFTSHQEEALKLQTILNEAAILQTRVWKMQYAKAEEVARILQDNQNSLLSKRGHVHVDARTNSLCVQDTLTQLLNIKKVINQFDIPIQQVLIEARLASIDNDFERELGINFAVVSERANTHPSAERALKRYSLAVAQLADGSQLDIQLAALEQQGHGELISSPSLFTANQQTASIEAGEEIPYQEISESGGTAIAFKKAVLSLKVTPQVLPQGKVLLQLQVNQDRPSSRMVLGVPAISTRQITTNVLVKNGKTIVLGGIYESNQEQMEQRIPFLGKIPLVGWLFKQQNVTKNKRELLIFVTPKIISQ